MFAEKIHRRLNWYKARLQINNPVVGRAVEMLGNKVRMDGLTYSVDCPNISRGHKSTLAFGLHEIEERELIRRWLPSDIPVIEFGGGLGVVSCLANQKLDDRSQHIVVEANPAMIEVLERNRELNNCQFQVVNKAIAYGSDHVGLNLDGEFVGATIKGGSSKAVRVQTTTISELMSTASFDQVGIICDIEGSEFDMIKREFSKLGPRIRYLMVEMHPKILGQSAVVEMIDDLFVMGFSIRQQIGDSFFFDLDGSSARIDDSISRD